MQSMVDGALAFTAGKISTNQCFHSLFMCLCDHCMAQVLCKIEMLQTRLWKKIYYYFYVCVYVNVTMGSCNDQKGAFDPPELEEWVIVNYSTWVLHTEFQFSASTHMYWAFSLLPMGQLGVLFSFTVTVAHLLASNKYKFVNVKSVFKYVQFLAN